MTTTFTAEDLQWTDASLWTQFEALAQAAPTALALVSPDGQTWSRAELSSMAMATAAHLRQHGLRPGDRVMLRACKTAPTLAAALAVSSLGGILCPFTPDLGRSEREVLQQRLNHLAVISDSSDDTFDDASEDAGDEASTGLPRLSELPGVPRLGQPDLPPLRLKVRDRADLAPADPRDALTALIGFTSGTTGLPKGVMHSSAAMNYACRACAQIADLAPGDAIAGLVPLASAPGFTFSVHFALASGHPLVLVDPWEPMRALRLIDNFQCRWAMCVPTQLTAMIETARAGQWTRPSPLRALAVGGSAMTPELVADAERLLGIRVLRMFGMSECMGHASTRPSDAIALRGTSDGKPFPGTVDEAFDPELRMLPRGQRGQAGVRGPSLFIGYCKGLGDNEARFTPDGYFLTGDEIVHDAQGHLRVVGRIKDQIIRGGYNIDPAEVEAALQTHPAIAAVALVAVPEHRLGEQACAACCIRDLATAPTLEDLKQHLAGIGLSKKKWPEHLLILEQLPLTATGKVDKKQLARLALTALKTLNAPAPH
ncbi:class I adenylate-forming enzyme family protein [Aquabacterium sp.]|uniref:class I adenylate-forming enzyme family protein n=1 Tax=Aquabacterium sp. TaxID=1872578 RepID=UPI002BF8F577|nr:class I adenylate-forming enzyme family protein [Aquabacterium sp.]HSW06703.1 class I adenylate-forming enzyme family protein [Aquabacterium sp.]